MTTPAKTTPAKKTTPRTASPAPAAAVQEETCNVPSCPAKPTTRGLCDPHWATHRGYASPSTKKKGASGV